jgi:hypothetical protein
MLLVHVHSTRGAGRALSVRAMWHAGEGRIDEAWQDLLAVHRLSRLTTQGNTLVEQLVAIALSEIACEGTATLLGDKRMTLEQSRNVQRDLAALPNFAVMARSLDTLERLMAINAFIRVGNGGGGQMFSAISGGAQDDFGTNAFNVISVDWNIVLRETNRWYDRLAAAAQLPDYQARQTALKQIEADMQQLVMETRAPSQLIASVMSRQQRSKVVSGIMLGLFLPAVTAATDAEERANITVELTRLAAALAVYRAEHDAYPESLDGLVPTTVAQLPVDLYSSKPFIYKRDGEGYLLYSAGANGVDDGGSNERFGVLKGISLDELGEAELNNQQSKIPAGADDFSLRVPRPAFELPNITVSQDPH